MPIRRSTKTTKKMLQTIEETVGMPRSLVAWSGERVLARWDLPAGAIASGVLSGITEAKASGKPFRCQVVRADGVVAMSWNAAPSMFIPYPLVAGQPCRVWSKVLFDPR
jgi:hypothetical protein